MKTGMEKAILDFPAQFTFAPRIGNVRALKRVRKYLVVGMGGSRLSADVLKMLMPELSLFIHSDYGLPALPWRDLKDHLVILNSYSGNTEEVVEAFHAGRKKGLNMAVITVGGALLELAKEHGVPFVRLPDTKIQPRMSLGFGIIALLALMGQSKKARLLRKLADRLRAGLHKSAGRTLAKELVGSVPVIYASRRNETLATNWKIKFNETGKIPAFWNVVPELNHNEMTGFDATAKTRKLSGIFHFLLLRDAQDTRPIQRRLQVLERLLKGRKLPVTVVTLSGKTRAERVFNSLLTADWTAYHLALRYGVEPEQVPMVEEFKKLIAK